MADEHDIFELCAALGVSRSGYHAWKTRAPSARARANARLLTLITQAHQAGRQTYGNPRVHQWLQRHGQRCGRQRVARLMRGQGLRRQTKRRFRVSLTDSHHDLPIAPNRLRQAPTPAKRDAVWVADITCVDTAEGWLYVAGIWDRHTRPVRGLGDGPDAGHQPAAGGAGHGALAAPARGRPGASLRSRRAIRQ